MKPNVKFHYINIESFIVRIKLESISVDLAGYVMNRSGTCNYEVKRPSLIGKKIIGLTRGELGRKNNEKTFSPET